jgi:hypothetical protein
MSKAEWYGPPRTERRVETEFPMHHHIPFEWGTFQVSEAANAAYGLVPLSPNQERGPFDTSQQEKKAVPSTNIYLLGPDEMLVNFGLGIITSQPSFDEKGVSIHVSLSNTLDGMREKVEGFLDGAEAEDVEGSGLEEIYEAVQDFIVDDDSTRVEAALRQSLIHLLLLPIGNTTVQATKDWLRSDLNRSAYKLMRNAAKATLGIPAAVGTMELVTYGKIDPVQAAGIGAIILYGAVRVGSETKKYLKNEGVREAMLELPAAQYTDSVLNDIHEAYCSAHFDRQTSTLLEEE